MSQKFIAMAVGGMALVFAAAPLGLLHSQVAPPGANPRGTFDTTKTSTGATPTTPRTTTPTQASNAEAVRAEMNTDLPFLQQAASSNLMEIQLGQLAQSKASNSAVKQFGKRMVTDHTRLEQQLSSMTSKNGVTFNATLNSEAQQKVTQLQNLSGDQFDRGYLTMMIQDHQRDVNDFQGQSQSANSPQVRQLAANSLPILRQHLTLAQQVGSQVNATASTPAVVAANNNAQTSRDFQADHDFIVVNAANNYMEVLIGRLGVQRAQNADVRSFAERIVKDHNRLQDEWVKMAADNGMKLTPGMGKNHRKKLTRLEKLSGSEFDREFMNTMIDTHKDYSNSMEKQSREAHSAAVRNMAQRSLPTLREHFQEAKRIGAKVGSNTKVTLRNE